ncbi:MAG: hypothetical protein E7360_03970 [Clostridiales bacterium]|nr:hypothetical protein [Clostridiales bacterium]
MDDNKCKNCMYAEKVGGAFGDWYCRLNTTRDIFGREKYLKIDPNASCANFSQAYTPESSGYTGSRSNCYLTSACVEYMGKDDDCEELTVLRQFRDDVLSKTEEGKALVKRYYEVAPNIVAKIEISNDKEKYYGYIYEKVKKCIVFLKENKHEDALNLYKEMVETLDKEL